MTIISSQRYIDDEIVAAKITSADFDVLISPEFEIDGDTFQVVLDGHHSLAAAREAGVDPVFCVATPQDHDAVGLIKTNLEDFLMITRMDSDFYDVATGRDVW